MIESERLILREWRDEDIRPFHAMGHDPEVMRHLGPPMSLEDAKATVTRVNSAIAADGCAFWAIERKVDGAFLGFCGIKWRGPPDTPIANDPEIGWRLAREAWGQGYAREAAEASLAWAWVNTDAPRITAITTPGNERSWGLMIRLGMTRVSDGDFDHPSLAPDDPLLRHIMYEIARP